MFAVFVLSGVLDVGAKFRVQCLRFSMWDVVPEGFRILRFRVFAVGFNPLRRWAVGVLVVPEGAMDSYTIL